jgi:pimeloyl-ACP methyl ester carboxylesterase
VIAQEMASVKGNAACASADELMFPTGDAPSGYDVEIGKMHPEFGSKPVLVLTEGNGEPLPAPSPAAQKSMTDAWRAGQQAIAKLSARGKDIIVPDSSHYIQIDQPAAVITAVKQIVLEVRAST